MALLPPLGYSSSPALSFLSPTFHCLTPPDDKAWLYSCKDHNVYPSLYMQDRHDQIHHLLVLWIYKRGVADCFILLYCLFQKASPTLHVLVQISLESKTVVIAKRRTPDNSARLWLRTCGIHKCTSVLKKVGMSILARVKGWRG